MLITDAEIAGRPGLALRIVGGRIDAIDVGLAPRPDEVVFDARGGAVLPGLHDHHIHLFATARARTSVPCGPPDVVDERGLVGALQAAADPADAAAEVRGIGYHESVAGLLDADRLEAWLPGRPLRIQHRTGQMWVLNRAAMRRIRAPLAEWPDRAERGADGRPTGRFIRLDEWLRGQLGGGGRPPLAALSRALAACGITGVTDTTPSLDDDDARFVRDAIECGAWLQRTVLMGSEGLSPVAEAQLVRGPLKIILDEPALPDFDGLVARMRAAHAGGRAVAVHCVTRAELALAVTALREAGAVRGDRIEHASVAPPDWIEVIAGTPIAVVTQPHFVHERGDAYLKDVEPEDRPWLYRARAWLDAGVPLAAGSDAPHGHVDPWRCISAAMQRRTRDGAALGPAEALTPEEGLLLFTSDPLQPGVGHREIRVGAEADLIVLDAPWRDMRAAPDAQRVCLSVRDGRVIHARDAPG